MNETLPRTPNAWGREPAELPVGHQMLDYTRRIHFWVRLFGIIWIIIPAVTMIIALAFAFGVASSRP